MVRIRRFGIIRTATMAAALYAFIILASTLLIFLPFALLAGAAGRDATGSLGFGAVGVVGVVIFGLVGAVVYAAIGWVMTAIACMIYKRGCRLRGRHRGPAGVGGTPVDAGLGRPVRGRPALRRAAGLRADTRVRRPAFGRRPRHHAAPAARLARSDRLRNVAGRARASAVRRVAAWPSRLTEPALLTEPRYRRSCHHRWPVAL